MQGGLHPDLKIAWHSKCCAASANRFPEDLHCYPWKSLPSPNNSELSIRDTMRASRCRLGFDPAAAPRFSREFATRNRRLKCLTEDLANVHRTAHQLGMRTTATMMFGVGRTTRNRINHFQRLYDCRKKPADSPPSSPGAFSRRIQRWVAAIGMKPRQSNI